MQFLLDHIAAVVITGFIILILAAISFRGQTSSIDSVQYYAQKRNLLDLVQWTERDFTNIGAGVVPVSTTIQAGDFDTSGTVKHFQFRARPDSSVAVPSLFRYEWEQVGTHELDVGTVPAIAVRRLVDGALSGQSAGYISTFRIDFFAQGGTPVPPEVDSMRVIRVDVKAVSPLGPTENIQQSQWTKVFRPVNLTRPN